MRPFFLLFLIPFSALQCLAEDKPTTPPAALDALVLRQEIWDSTEQGLQEEIQNLGFEWTSTAKDSARAAHPGLVLGQNKIAEAILRFSAGKPTSMTLSFYNRGDSGNLTEEAFQQLKTAAQNELTRLTGGQALDRGRDPTSAVKAEGLFWEGARSLYTLEWSETQGSRSRGIPYRAEFLRLTVTPKSQTPVRVGATPPPKPKDVVKAFNPREKVEQLPNGDVRLPEVPMVDQGDKGYCVVATVERVMRYYGAHVDQNELAQIAGTDAERGTSVQAMLESLEKLTARLGIRVKKIYELSYKDFIELMEDYNRATKRGKLAPQVVLAGRVISIRNCYASVNPTIFREVCLNRSADFGKFQRDVMRSIDEGIPLLWSVQLGLVKESDLPQAHGGHMRMIIGYNKSTGEILYSDSWGSGHEEKRMKFDDAWMITNSLTALLPQ